MATELYQEKPVVYQTFNYNKTIVVPTDTKARRGI